MSIGKSTVDERIVEMRIDNEKFEAGAKKTIGILESLDRSLKGLGQDNATGFDNIEKSLDKVTDRFSAMGIVGDQVMRNLTNKAMELVGQFKNMATMLTTQQIDAGWNKYADKTQAIQTIMAATSGKIDEGFFANQAEQMSWVNEQIEKLNKFTDETSYNFLDMVGNIGKFTAAGRELEESVTAMEGIANWAAISGGRPAEAGRAMYNLSQALGMGAVTTIDWKSIENANMATYEFKQQAIDAAVAMGTLKKVADGVWETIEGGYEVTVENFRNSLSFGRGTDAIHWFNSDVLLSVLNRYGQFSDEVMKVVEGTDLTVTQYLKLLKAYKEGDVAFQDQIESLSLTSDEVRELLPDLERLSAAEYDLGFRAFQAAQEAKTFTEAIDATKDAVSTKWMTVFELLFGNYLEAKELWTQLAETFWDIFAQPVDHLIDIIKGARGFLGEDGLFSAFTSGAKQAAGSTAVLEDRLSAVGKTMDDFKKALYTVSDRQLIDTIENYNSVEEALSAGAISAETFKKALGALDDSYDTKKPVSLNRALNKAGKTMQDFEKALKEAMDPKDVVNALGSYKSIEDAFRNGAISVDDFKKALSSLGIESENVTDEVEETVAASVSSLEELRELALEVLRGDHGNGDERLAWYEQMGLDSELMQAMAGDLKNMGYYMSDEALMAAMESYYQYNNLSARLGYETFAEYLASISSATSETIYDMNQMADEADDIYASLFGEGVLDEYGEYVSAGELFRTSLMNLMEALDNFGAAFDKAFMKVFGGGSDNYDEQVARMSDGFFTLTAAFYSFSESVKSFSESDAFLNFATAMFSILRMIGKAISLVFKIAKTGLSVVMKLLSPVLNLLSGVFDMITTGLDALSRSFESSGIMEFIEVLSDELLEKISKPIEKISDVIDKLIEAFKAGFEDGGGIAGGIRNVSEAIDVLFQNHPVFLTVVHAIGNAILFLKDAVEALAMVLGSVFGGAVVLVIGAFQKLGEWFGAFITWAQSSEIMTEIWNALTEAVAKFGRVIKRVFNYAKAGYEEDGVIGALTAIVDSFERGITRLVPGGEKLVSIFNSIKSAVKDIFKKKTVDENGIVQTVDDTENSILKLEETISTYSNVLRDGALGDEEQQASFKDHIKQLVANAWAGFLEGLRDIRISDVIDALRLGVIANVLLKVGHSLNIFNQLGENIKDIPETFSDMFEDLGRTFRSLSFDIKANAVLKFAVAAGMIAGAIFILSRIPEDKLEKASSVVISILTVLSLFIAVLGKTSANILNSIQYLVAFGTSLVGLAAVISSIGLTALTLALVSKFVGAEHLKEAVSTILKIVGRTVGLIAALIILIKRGNINEWGIKALGNALRGMGAGLIGIALAVQMLMVPILAFSLVLKFARGEAGLKKFKLAVGAVIAIMLTIGVMVWMLSAAANGFTADQIGQLGTFMIKIAAGLMIMALAVQMLAMPILILAAAQKFLKFNINGIIGSFAVLGIIALLIAGILAVFGGVMSNKTVAQIKVVGNALIKMAASMLLIAVGVGLLVKPIIKIAELSERMETKHIIGALGALVVTIGILAGILALLNKVVMKGQGGFKGLGAGEGLMKIAAGIFLLAAAALVLTPAIILMSAAIAGFAYVLGTMKTETWEIFENGLTRLGTFSKYLAGFGAALLLVGLAATLTGTGIIAMSAGILIFAAAMAIVMTAMPKIADTFEKLKNIDPASLGISIGKVMLILGSLMLVLVMFMLTINRLYSILGGGVFRKIGNNFVKTIQDIALGVRSGISNGFTSVIQFLKNEENKKTILSILESLILVGAAYVAGILPTVAHVVIGGLVGLLNAVAAEINAQSSEIVDAISNIAEAILNIAKGLIAKIFGEESWSDMSWWQKGIADLGGGLLIINKVAGLFSFGKAESSAKSLSDKIFNLAENITDSKKRVTGLKDEFSNTKAAVQLLVEAAGGLSIALPIALALAGAVAFANHELNEQQDILRQSAGDPKSLEEYANSIAQVEARITELTEQSKNGLGTEMSEQELQAQQLLLSSLRKEYEALKETMSESPTEAVRDYVAELQEMKAAVDAIEDSREKSGAMTTYRQALEEDAAAMGVTVEALREMVEGYNTLEVKTQNVKETAGTGLTELTEQASALKETLSTQLGENTSLDAAREKLKGIKDELSNTELGTYFSSFFDSLNIESMGTEELTSTTNVLKDLAGMIPGGIGEGIRSKIDEVSSALTDVSDVGADTFASENGIASPSARYAELAQWIPAGIGMGIDQNYYQAVNPLYSLMDEMVNAFTNVQTNFVGAGKQIVAGLVQGISDNMIYAYEVGENLATSVENGFRETLDIHSPSRVFAQLARYIPLGIEEGINTESASAITSVTVLGDALINAIMQSMAMVSTIADEDFEMMPRITPVVDMSNVDSAANAMSSAFGSGYSMSAQMTNDISRRMNDVERIASNIGQQNTVNNGDNITFNIYGAEGQDPDEIADAVMLRMQNRAVRREAAFG